MKLSEEQYRQLVSHVEHSMNSPGACGVCRANDWNISREVFKLTAFQEGSQVTARPLCVLSCGSCGNTLFIDARYVFGNGFACSATNET